MGGLQQDHMGLDFRIMVRQRFHAVGVGALLADPLQGHTGYPINNFIKTAIHRTMLAPDMTVTVVNLLFRDAALLASMVLSSLTSLAIESTSIFLSVAMFASMSVRCFCASLRSALVSSFCSSESSESCGSYTYLELR